MTVAELIAELQKHDPERPVLVYGDTSWGEINFAHKDAEAVSAGRVLPGHAKACGWPANDYDTDPYPETEPLCVDAVVIE